jgi:hypothetical protein
VVEWSSGLALGTAVVVGIGDQNSERTSAGAVRSELHDFRFVPFRSLAYSPRMNALVAQRPRWVRLLSGPLPVLLVVAAAIVPRLPLLRSDVELVWHDRAVLLEDPRTADVGSIPGYLSGPYFRDADTGLYRPMVLATLTVERALLEARPWLHRAVNLGLHALAAVLLLVLGRRLVPERPIVPLLAALLFAEHPAATEVVAWIVARGDSGAAVFSLLALLLALSRRPAALFGAAACLLVAMLFKPVAAVVPGAFLLVAVNREQRRFRDLFRPATVIPLLFLTVPVAAAFLLRRAAVGSLVPVEDVVLRDVGFLTRLIVAGGLLVRNLLTIVFPIGLTGDYRPDPAWRDGPWSPPTVYLLGTFLVLAGIAWLVLRRRRGSLEVFGILWAALFLLPVLHVVPIGMLVADRFLYLPAMGIALAGASAIDRLAGGVASSTFRARLVGLGVGVLLTCFAALGLARNASYHDDGVFHRHVLERFPWDPGSRWRPEGLSEVKVRLGAHYARRAREAEDPQIRRAYRVEADACFREATALAPKASGPLLRHGRLLLAQGELEEGIKKLQIALHRAATGGKSMKVRARIRTELAVAHVRMEESRRRGERRVQGDPIGRAEAHLRKALHLHPRSARARYWLGMIEIRFRGDEEEGIRLLKEAAEQDPDLAPLVRKQLSALDAGNAGR